MCLWVNVTKNSSLKKKEIIKFEFLFFKNNFPLNFNIDPLGSVYVESGCLRLSVEIWQIFT